MEIELSEDLQHYKETIALGLTARQLLFSILSVGVGALIVLLLHKRVGMTLSCYIATPVVAPLALAGFYSYHGLSFGQFLRKMIYFTFFNRPLLYDSTENMEELSLLFAENEKERIRAEQTSGEGKSDVKKIKAKAIIIIGLVVLALTAAITAIIWIKLSY